MSGSAVHGQSRLVDLFICLVCNCVHLSRSNPELIFSSVISLATKCAMPSFRMHLRAHGMVAMVFKTLDDSQHHQVWRHRYFRKVWLDLSTLCEFYSCVVQGHASSICAISGSIWEICCEMKNKSACVPMTNSPSTVICFWVLKFFEKNKLLKQTDCALDCYFVSSLRLF